MGGRWRVYTCRWEGGGREVGGRGRVYRWESEWEGEGEWVGGRERVGGREGEEERRMIQLALFQIHVIIKCDS